MDKLDLIAKLKVIVTAYAEDEEALASIDENTDFIKDLKINSANLVDVVLDIEDEFNIEIENDAMAKMLNVKAAMDIIETKLAAIDR